MNQIKEQPMENVKLISQGATLNLRLKPFIFECEGCNKQNAGVFVDQFTIPEVELFICTCSYCGHNNRISKKDVFTLIV